MTVPNFSRMYLGRYSPIPKWDTLQRLYIICTVMKKLVTTTRCSLPGYFCTSPISKRQWRLCPAANLLLCNAYKPLKGSYAASLEFSRQGHTVRLNTSLKSLPSDPYLNVPLCTPRVHLLARSKILDEDDEKLLDTAKECFRHRFDKIIQPFRKLEAE